VSKGPGRAAAEMMARSTPERSVTNIGFRVRVRVRLGLTPTLTPKTGISLTHT